jgi:DNA polymerase-4
VVLAAARGLLGNARPTIERQGLTLIGLTVANLDETADQLSLPLDPRSALDVAVDEVRDRFGAAALIRAVQLGRSERQSVPLLPD